MSHVTTRLYLTGGRPPLPAHQFKLCSKCNESRPPEGGIDLGPGKWHCAMCWSRRVWRKK